MPQEGPWLFFAGCWGLEPGTWNESGTVLCCAVAGAGGRYSIWARLPARRQAADGPGHRRRDQRPRAVERAPHGLPRKAHDPWPGPHRGPPQRPWDTAAVAAWTGRRTAGRPASLRRPDGTPRLLPRASSTAGAMGPAGEWDKAMLNGGYRYGSCPALLLLKELRRGCSCHCRQFDRRGAGGARTGAARPPTCVGQARWTVVRCLVSPPCQGREKAVFTFRIAAFLAVPSP